MSDLIARLETAPAGSAALSREVFLALGGEFRTAPASNQGGADVTLPYWPGEKDPCVGIALTTNLNDLAHLLERLGLSWAIDCNHGRAFALVGDNDRPGRAATPSLALCAALLRCREVNR